MKYILIPFIAFGLTLSLIFGVEYNCEGPEAFPTYYGSPFVFMRKSLGSSMEYYYSISGLILNVIIWSLLLVGLRYAAMKLIENSSFKNPAKFIYKLFVGILVIFTYLNISMAYICLARGFNENLNYWYWNLDRNASNYGMKCEGEWKFTSFY